MIDRKKVLWFILLRLLVVSVFLVTTLYLDVHTYDVSGEIARDVLIRLIGATYLFSLGSLVVLRLARRQFPTLAYAQIVWDLILVTVLILISGGVTSPYAFLYFLSIISASILLARSQAYYTASLCVILYGAILDFQYYGRLAPLGLSQLPAQQYGAAYLFYLIFLYSAAFYLTAFLAGHLSERARLSESALKEKAIDYEELERLNSCIVSTIDSGLLTINSEGKIRVFNRYAEHLTGVSQRDAYDRPLSEVIPGFARFREQFFGGVQGEFEHRGPDGRQLLFSFKSVPLPDKEGLTVGAIFDLHDLTEMKRMAGELKRADRLAAVGEGGDHQHRGLGGLGLDPGEELDPPESRHADVRDHHLVALLVHAGKRVLRALRLVHQVPLAIEKDGEKLPHAQFIINHQNPGAHLHLANRPNSS